MNKVLLIAYYYPPLGGIGSLRSQKFACYLPEYGWQPIVLAPERGSSWVDPSLKDGRDQGIEVIRTPTINFSAALQSKAHTKTANGDSHSGARHPAAAPVGKRALMNRLKHAVRTWVYIPDGQIGWFPYALRAGRKLLKTQDVDAIWSTSFPLTAHLVAYRLKAATNKPWVADFRDLWTDHQHTGYSSALRKRLDHLIEAKLLDRADAIVTVSHTLAEELRRLTRGQKRIEVIRNGFDSADFAGIPRTEPSKWTVTFVGSYYNFYNPSPCLAALQHLIASGRIAKADAQIVFVGEAHPQVQDMATHFGLAEITRFTGLISHREAIKHQVNASLLLFCLHGESAHPGHITGKLYEYLGARRPILGIVSPDFEAARLIQEAGAGVALAATDGARIEQFLMDSYTGFKAGANRAVSERDLSTYERRYGAQQLANLLAELLAR